MLRIIQLNPEYLEFERNAASQGPSTQGRLNQDALPLALSTGVKTKKSFKKPKSAAASDPFLASGSDNDKRMQRPRLSMRDTGSREDSSTTQSPTDSSVSLSSRRSFRAIRHSFRRSPSKPSSRAPSPTGRDPTPDSITPSATNVSISPSLAPSLMPHDPPPVPPLPPLENLMLSIPPFNPSAAPTSKPLAFRDLLIKPIQRVCRYPLLLSQLRLPPSFAVEFNSKSALALLERAIDATRSVAAGVDDAQKKRDIAVKTRLIGDRLEPNSVGQLIPSFVPLLFTVVAIRYCLRSLSVISENVCLPVHSTSSSDHC